MSFRQKQTTTALNLNLFWNTYCAEPKSKMTDQPIEQFLRQPPRPQRPKYISLPALPRAQSSKELPNSAKNKLQDSTIASKVPRPPIPPRRHTLAEICRYADEQCAYIEWMTRELEAEEAIRRHSSPTTPAGAITNPFTGPADMWWRPTSANEMYGKSELRNRQEEEDKQASKQHPYLVSNSQSELVERDRPVVSDDLDAGDFQETPGSTRSSSWDVEMLDMDTRYSRKRDQTTAPLPDKSIKRLSGIPRCATWPGNMAITRADISRVSRLNLHDAADTPDHSSIFIVIPKVLLCLLLLPILISFFWYDNGHDLDDVNIEDDLR